MTRPSRHNEDFNIIEITEREDFRSPAGRLIATQSLRGPHDTLFLSTPCTGGSKWTTINRHKGGEETNLEIDRHVELFWELWESFVIVLKHAERVRARVFIELPRHCLYWKDRRITSVLEQYGSSMPILMVANMVWLPSMAKRLDIPLTSPRELLHCDRLCLAICARCVTASMRAPSYQVRWC